MQPFPITQIICSDHLFTGLAKQPQPGAVALNDNRIAAVGNKTEILALRSPGTLVQDYGDALILPGFHDDYVHLLQGGMLGCYADLAAAKSAAEAAQQLAGFYQIHPQLLQTHSWALGFNWYHFWWNQPVYPQRFSLDQYFPETPVLLLNADCHGAWLNSKALKLCNITRETPEVSYGKIFRDQEGNPTGYLEENVMALAIPTAYCFSQTQEKAVLQQSVQQFSKFGVTSVNDMEPFFGVNLARPQTLSQLEQHEQLPIRIHFANNLFDDWATSSQLAAQYQSGKLIYNGLKQFLDGIITTHTAVMLQRACDSLPHPLG